MDQNAYNDQPPPYYGESKAGPEPAPGYPQAVPSYQQQPQATSGYPQQPQVVPGYPQQPYPPPGFNNPGPPPPGQQTVVVVQQPDPYYHGDAGLGGAVVGRCPNCQVGMVRDNFTLIGLLWFFLCFPCGIICCMTMTDKRCSHCGYSMNP